jgi:nucleoside phosphorylase/CheY-like chemotaxis protein
MKILVVEDDANKLRRIVASLIEIDGVTIHDVSQVSDASRAKAFLLEHEVDLIVLDLHLPDRIDLPAKPEGGLEFMRSISTRPKFFVPTHVVAVSGNTEAMESATGAAGELWGVIRYDASSNDWSESLKSRVRYALAAWRSSLGRPRATRPCDFAIITALADELAGVLRLPLTWREHVFDGDGTIYHEATLSSPGGTVTLVAATANRMGMAATATLASKIIDLYRPRYLCMTGITGGIRGRVALGDVLVADPSWDWGSGKYEVVQGKPRFAASPDQLRLSSDIRDKLVAASRDEALLSKVRSGFPGSKPGNVLGCHVEAVASGASVLGDDAVVEEIKLQHRKLHGVEMEIYGLMMAAEICAKPRPIAFSTKAVSDFADTTKNDDLRDYAIHVSTNFAFEFVTKYLL